eukprot:scaffold953_cov141-Cylindrotheca_fusiformis.AAC.10
MNTFHCDFTKTFCERPLNSRNDEDEMVASFFSVPSTFGESNLDDYSLEQKTTDSFDQSTRNDRLDPHAFDDDLLEHDLPASPSSRITVYTRDATNDHIYRQHAAAAALATKRVKSLPSKWTKSHRQRQNRHQIPASPSESPEHLRLSSSSQRSEPTASFFEEQKLATPSPKRPERSRSTSSSSRAASEDQQFTSPSLTKRQEPTPFNDSHFVPITMPSHSSNENPKKKDDDAWLSGLGFCENKQLLLEEEQEEQLPSQEVVAIPVNQQQDSFQQQRYEPDTEESVFPSCCVLDGSKNGGNPLGTQNQRSPTEEDEGKSRSTTVLSGDDLDRYDDDETILGEHSFPRTIRQGRGGPYAKYPVRSSRSSPMATRQRRLLLCFVLVSIVVIAGGAAIAYFILFHPEEQARASSEQAVDGESSDPPTTAPGAPSSPTMPSPTTLIPSPSLTPPPVSGPTNRPTIRYPTKPPTPQPVGPSAAPTPRDIDAILASEAYAVISKKVSNPELLLDLDTPQGKAFQLIYQQYVDGFHGRWLAQLTPDEEYRMVQRYVLMVFYYGTRGDDLWLFNMGWKDFEADECKWQGVVSCNEANAVTNIKAVRVKIGGTLPEELCLLTELEVFILNRNLLSGEIPECLTALPNLKQLELRSNHLSGPFPDNLFASSTLVSLDLSNNEFTGNIVGSPPSSSLSGNPVASNSRIKEIRLNNNELSGEINNVFIHFNLLETLTLHGNDLTGGIDALCLHPIKEFTADCDKLTCTCCTQCYYDP